MPCDLGHTAIRLQGFFTILSGCPYRNIRFSLVSQKILKFLILYKLQTELNEFEEEGIEVDRSKLKRCCRSSVKSFTTDELSCVFTDEELGTSSVSGKPNNFNPNSQAKPALDPKRLNAVESKHFLFLYYNYIFFLTLHIFL